MNYELDLERPPAQETIYERYVWVIQEGHFSSMFSAIIPSWALLDDGTIHEGANHGGNKWLPIK